MFQEVKDTLPIMGDDYDAQIIREIKACAIDLTSSAEINLPGEITITREQNQQATGRQAYTLCSFAPVGGPKGSSFQLLLLFGRPPSPMSFY